MPRKKVSIVGAGQVGATAAYYIAEKIIADIVMVDINEGLTRAKALDFLHAGPMRRYDVSIEGTKDYSRIEGSDVVVITAGLPRKPGMDRMDLLKVNAGIVKSASENIAAYAPNATVIVVSNPLDVMWQAFWTPPASVISSRKKSDVLRPMFTRWSWEVTETKWYRCPVLLP
jgi:malate dehydrogenase